MMEKWKKSSDIVINSVDNDITGGINITSQGLLEITRNRFKN